MHNLQIHLSKNSTSNTLIPNTNYNNYYKNSKEKNKKNERKEGKQICREAMKGDNKND